MKRIIIFFVFLLAGILSGKDYYVSQKDPKADDKNPGTKELPFKTINGVIPKLKPGDTVYIREGVYREEIILSKNVWVFRGKTYKGFNGGSSYSEMISFIGYPGEEVIIKGSDVVTGWKKYKDNIYVVDWPYNTQMVFCDGKILRQIGGKMVKYVQESGRWQGRYGEGIDDLQPVSFYEIKNKYNNRTVIKVECAGSFYYDIENKKLYVWLADNSDPNNHLIEVAVRPFFFFVGKGVNYIKISNIKMTHSNSTSYINWPPLNIGGSYCIIENVNVEWVDYIGISVGGKCNTVINSKFNWCGNSGMGGSGWGHRILNCEFKYNNWRQWAPGWHAGGLKIIPYAHEWIISDCEVAYNNGDGIWFDGWMSNVTIQNNISHHNAGSGIFYEIGNRGVIKNNICYENGQRGIYLQNSADTLVAHNLCYKNGMSGIAVVGTSRKGGVYGREEDEVLYVKNNVVWGNILIDNCFPGIAPKGWEGRAELILPDKRETNFNNFSDYNIFVRRDGRDIPFWFGWQVEVFNFEDWKTKTGNDKHSIVVNYPTVDLFVDIENYDFRPIRGAISINFVKPLMDVRYDITGFDRVYEGLKPGEKRKKFTAGPYEYREGL